MATKKILLASLFTLIIIFFSAKKPVFGQGTFSCTITHAGQCLLNKNECVEGYVPQDCSTWRGKPRECQNSIHECIKEKVQAACKAKNNLVSCSSDFPVECVPASLNQCCKTEADCAGLVDRPGTCDPGTGNREDGIATALGCIPAYNLNAFVAWFLNRAVFIATGIAFLLMAFGAIQIITSAGNPDKVKAGGELITSAISGLLLIILSLFLLKLIGVDILHIPAFGQ